MEFTVEIKEILSRTATVFAQSQEDALEIVRKDYRQGKYILGCEDFQNVDFQTKEETPCT